MAIFGALILCLGTRAAKAEDAAAQGRAMLGRAVNSFRVEGLSMFDALLQLGRQERVPLGLEYVDLEMVEKPINISLSATTVGDIVRAILSHGNGYRFRAEDGVVHISHRSVPSGPKNLLDRVLPEFSIPRSPVQEASHLLRMALHSELYPGVGVVGDYSGGGRVVVGPLRMRSTTVRQVLNRLVRDDGDALWVVQVPPQYLSHLPPEGLWRIVEYEDPTAQYTREALRQSFPR